jgi:hypothetical protein
LNETSACGPKGDLLNTDLTVYVYFVVFDTYNTITNIFCSVFHCLLPFLSSTGIYQFKWDMYHVSQLNVALRYFSLLKKLNSNLNPPCK